MTLTCRCPNIRWPGLGTNPEPGVNVLLLPTINPRSTFAPEVADIEGDRQLRGAVVAYLEGQIQRFADGESGPATLRPPDTTQPSAPLRATHLGHSSTRHSSPASGSGQSLILNSFPC